MVTLPKEWAESVKLKKNDPVSMCVLPDGSLVLFPNGMSSDLKYTTREINADDIKDRDFLYRQMVGAYIAGHRRIRVSSESVLKSSAVDAVTSFTQTAIGLEIVEEDDDYILIEDLINHSEIRPSKSIERMKVLVRNMIADVFESAFTGDLGPISNMDARDVEIDRIHWLISRQCSIHQKDVTLTRKVNMTLGEVTRCLSVSRIMERIGDHTVLVSKNLLELKSEGGTDSLDDDLRSVGTEMLKLFNDSVASWTDKDMDLAENCIKSGKMLAENIKTMFKIDAESDIGLVSATNLIAESSKRIAEYCVDISELTINAAMD